MIFKYAMKEKELKPIITISPLRSHVSKQGTLFLAGRTDETNEKLISQVKSNESVFHTIKPGSPFVNIKGIEKDGDEMEAAILCARYSRDWKKNKSDVEIHKFLGKDIYKQNSMKTGTFGVKKIKVINVQKEDIENFLLRPARKGELIEFQKNGILKLF